MKKKKKRGGKMKECRRRRCIEDDVNDGGKSRSSEARKHRGMVEEKAQKGIKEGREKGRHGNVRND